MSKRISMIWIYDYLRDYIAVAVPEVSVRRKKQALKGNYVLLSVI